MRRIVAIGGLAGLTAVLVGCGSAAAPHDAAARGSSTSPTAQGSCATAATITAHGTGSASQQPDTLTLVLSVTTSAGQAAAALQDNNTRTLGVIDVLKQGGVAASNLQTSGLSIDPVYSDTREPYITGYQVSDTVTAQIGEKNGGWVDAGAIIDRAAHVAGNAIQIQQVSFSLAHDGGLASLARAAAVTQAASQAAAMAKAADVTLGPLCSISDNASATSPEPIFAPQAGASSAAGLSSAVPLASGTEKVSAQVTAVYAVSQ